MKKKVLISRWLVVLFIIIAIGTSLTSAIFCYTKDMKIYKLEHDINMCRNDAQKYMQEFKKVTEEADKMSEYLFVCSTLYENIKDALVCKKEEGGFLICVSPFNDAITNRFKCEEW